MKIGIINNGINNIGSVVGSLNNLGIEYYIIENYQDFSEADKLILPGIGNFKKSKEILDKKKFTEQIKNKVLIEKIPILGICLGMQLLAKKGSEGSTRGFSEGLNLIEGTVENLKKLGSKLILPHIGWNNINKKSNPSIISSIPDETDFYFVHSYAYTKIRKEYIVAEAKYGISFPAIIQNENVWGTQFHPEKSSKAGLEVIKSFVKFRC